ncbi:MAG: GNAT family N-acetyltransferase [Rhodopseudomonas palustris]|uniref:GNAT family N-acetyltransferase n=1 Tax=Rhodopseudomonas palustris TaxID=1076 RepID=A0A933W3Q4_RHOPL|nr:GNAT family N-acetyltransferase [Rhodopseudomonas palustris]
MAFDLDDPDRATDTLRLRSGAHLTLRFAGPGDAAALQGYFRALSPSSRYNRLMGAAPELPETQLARFVRPGQDDAFTVLALAASDAGAAVIGELRYAHHGEDDAIEFGVSVLDRWHGQGIGAALLANLECRGAARGATRLYADTLRSNTRMIALARKTGYAFEPSPIDWKQTRLAKQVSDAALIVPCASLRLAAAHRRQAVGR